MGMTPEEKMEEVAKQQAKELEAQECSDAKYKCPKHGKCWCTCPESRRESDAYGDDYAQDYAEGDAPLPFLPPKPFTMQEAKMGYPSEPEGKTQTDADPGPDGAPPEGGGAPPAAAQASLGPLAAVVAIALPTFSPPPPRAPIGERKVSNRRAKG